MCSTSNVLSSQLFVYCFLFVLLISTIGFVENTQTSHKKTVWNEIGVILSSSSSSPFMMTYRGNSTYPSLYQTIIKQTDYDKLTMNVQVDTFTFNSLEHLNEINKGSDEKIIEKLDESTEEKAKNSKFDSPNKIRNDKTKLNSNHSEQIDKRNKEINGVKAQRDQIAGLVSNFSSQTGKAIYKQQLNRNVNLSSLDQYGQTTTGYYGLKNSTTGEQYCDPKTHFDCTLGDLSATGNLSSTDPITLNRQQQTNRAQSSSDFLVQDPFPLCIPIAQKCDQIPNCPDSSDESESICGCLSNEFYCNGTCIDSILRCNQKSDCPNGEDEKDCETYVCPPSHFKCDDHFCISNEKICDFRNDCGDGSDEKNCSFRRCWYGEFRCDNGQCIRTHAVCNGKMECIDGSDERRCNPDDFVDCGDNTQVHKSLRCDDWPDCLKSHLDEINCKECNETNQFRCPNGKCLQSNQVCDTICDCVNLDDKSACADEVGCEKFYNRHNHFLECTNLSLRCAAPKLDNAHYTGGLTTEKCVKVDHLCSGISECLSFGFGFNWPRPLDELGCKSVQMPNSTKTIPGKFTEDECLTLNQSNIWCSEGRCLSSEFRCNHFRECLLGEDEMDCNFTACAQNQFQCKSGECIEESKICDAKIDCNTKDDEFNCEQFKCDPSTEFKCDSGQCIDVNKRNDFFIDCPDHSDEKDIANNTRKCDNTNEFTCNNGQCIDKEHRCTYYGPNDRLGCLDGSHLQNCQNFTCDSTKLKCTDSYCVPLSFKCNGKIDCRQSWNDEEMCPFQCSEESKCACFDIQINCTFANLTSIPFNIEPEISRVLLSHNRLNQSSLSVNVFKRLYRIQILDLGYNDIEALPTNVFVQLWQLRVLYLNHNRLKVLNDETFTGLTHLRSLILNGNQLERIESFAFKGLSSLKALDLSHQKLKHIAKNAFRGLRVIINLDLSHNYLHSLEYGSLNGLASLLFLDLSHNKFHVMAPTLFNGLSSLQTLKTDEFRFCCFVNPSISCLPKPDQFSSCEDLMSNGILRFCIWILGLTSLLGNLVVIFWRLQYNNKNNRKKVHSFLIANLAIGDLLMGVYLLIIASVDAFYRGVYFIYDSDWRSSHLCQFSGFLSTLSSELSVFILTYITFDRFLAIVFPLRLKRDFKQTVVNITIIWFICFLIALIPILKLNYFDHHFYGRSGVCLALHITNEKVKGYEYSVFVFLFLNFCSFCLIAFAYTFMFFVARSTNRTDSSLNTTRYDAKVAKRIMIIVATDCVCWMPIFLLGILSLIGWYQIPPQVFAWVAVFVLPFNSAFNPLVYTISTSDFMIRSKKDVLQRMNTSLRQTEPGTISQKFSESCNSDEVNRSLNNLNRQATTSSSSDPTNLRFQLETNYSKDRYKSNLVNRIRLKNHSEKVKKTLIIREGKYYQSSNGIDCIISERKESDNRSNKKPEAINEACKSGGIRRNNVLYCLNVLSPRKQHVNLLNLRQPKYQPRRRSCSACRKSSSDKLNASSLIDNADTMSLRRTQSEYIKQSEYRQQCKLTPKQEIELRRTSIEADLNSMIVKGDSIWLIETKQQIGQRQSQPPKPELMNTCILFENSNNRGKEM